MTLAAEAGPRPQARFDGRLYAPLVLGAVLNPVNSSMIAVSLAERRLP